VAAVAALGLVSSPGAGATPRTVFHGGHYRFSEPLAVLSTGDHVWVTNPGNSTVTELSATSGAWIRSLSAASYQLNDPEALAIAGGAVWIASSGANALVEVNASNGSLIRVVRGRG
jgi:DNA-binding beta-propeller fold protein YncE